MRTEWAIAMLLLVAFAPALVALARVWSSVDYTSHGFLVPLVSAWTLLGTRRDRARLPGARDARGALVLGAALALYLASLAGGSVSGQGLALVAAVAGAVWLLRGLAWLRALAFPIGFLVFMIPPPPDWIAPVVVKLQLFVSQAAVGLLQAAGATVAREGNVILVPGGELFVAEACSGVTSVVTLTPLAVLLAWFLRTSALGSAALLAAVVPVAMTANLLRVVGTVVAAGRFGVAAVTEEGIHQTAGLAVYALGCLGLIALAGALARGRTAA